MVLSYILIESRKTTDMKKRLFHTEHRLQYNYAVDDIPITKWSSYSCYCNSSTNISIHRHRLDTMNSIQ
jgi:hypothetical protein